MKKSILLFLLFFLPHPAFSEEAYWNDVFSIIGDIRGERFVTLGEKLEKIHFPSTCEKLRKDLKELAEKREKESALNYGYSLALCVLENDVNLAVEDKKEIGMPQFEIYRALSPFIKSKFLSLDHEIIQNFIKALRFKIQKKKEEMKKWLKELKKSIEKTMNKLIESPEG